MLAYNSSAVNPTFEANLLSYHVFLRGQDHIDVNLKLHKADGLLVVHLPDHLARLRDLGLDLTEGAHPNIKLITITYEQTGGHLTFVNARSNKLPTLHLVGEERVGKLVAMQRSDYLGRPSLIVKVEGVARRAEAFGTQLDEIRALGIKFDALKPRTWTDAPTGYLVRYIAPKVGPNLEFVALEREAAPAAPSTPTDGAPAMGLLPAWAETVSERLIYHHEEFISRVITVHSDETLKQERRRNRIAPKQRRYLSQRPARPESPPSSTPEMVIGENAYAFLSDKWERLPRDRRHDIMHHLDPLIDGALEYTLSGDGLSGVASCWDALRRTLYSVRSQVAPDMPTANPIQKLETVYATQQSEAAKKAAAELKQLAKEWLRVRINPKSHEHIAQTKREHVKITFRLEGFGDNKYIRVLLHAPILKNYQVSADVRSKSEGKGALKTLWDTFDRRVEKMITAQTSRRPEYKETRAPIMPPMPSRLH